MHRVFAIAIAIRGVVTHSMRLHALQTMHGKFRKRHRSHWKWSSKSEMEYKTINRERNAWFCGRQFPLAVYNRQQHRRNKNKK